MSIHMVIMPAHLDFVHEASPVSFAQQPPNKSLGLKVLKLIHVLTCSDAR